MPPWPRSLFEPFFLLMAPASHPPRGAALELHTLILLSPRAPFKRARGLPWCPFLGRGIPEHPSRPDGIRYRPEHDLSWVAVAIFERAVECYSAVEGYSGNFEGRGLRCENGGVLLDPAIQQLLGEILETRGNDLA